AHLGRDRRLFVPVVRHQGEIVALAPWGVRPPGISSVQPFPVLEFLGTGSVGSDYLDVIVRRGHEGRGTRRLAQGLSTMNRAAEMEQSKVRGSAAAGLGAILERLGWSVSIEETNLSRFIDLKGRSWPDYLAGLGPSHRYNLNRRLRQL